MGNKLLVLLLLFEKFISVKKMELSREHNFRAMIFYDFRLGLNQ